MEPSSPGPAQSPDERFDVVNERDEVIGQATRAEVHARGLWHRAVHVWVLNAAGAVFLQKRSRWKDLSPQRWDSSCSGHLDSGESYEAAAVRELGEEIGWRVPGPSALTPVLRVPAQPATGFEFMQVYATRGDGPFQLHPAEIEEGRWWTEAEVDTAIAQTPDLFTGPFRLLWSLGRSARQAFRAGEAPQGK